MAHEPNNVRGVRYTGGLEVECHNLDWPESYKRALFELDQFFSVGRAAFWVNVTYGSQTKFAFFLPIDNCLHRLHLVFLCVHTPDEAALKSSTHLAD